MGMFKLFNVNDEIPCDKKNRYQLLADNGFECFYFSRFRPLSTLFSPAANNNAADEYQNKANKAVNGDYCFHRNSTRLI
jgi:hypothetical protein